MTFDSLAVASALIAGFAVEAWGNPEIVFREEAHPDLNAVRKWAEIRTDRAEDELTGVVFSCDPVAIDDGGRWTMPFQWPRLSHRRSDFVEGKRYDGGWGEDPCPFVVEQGDGTWTMWLADASRPYSDQPFLHVNERTGTVEVAISFQSRGYVHAGRPQQVGDVWVLRGTGGLEGALAQIPAWYAAVGQHPPAGYDRNRMLNRVLYSTGMKGPVENSRPSWGPRGEYDGGFRAKREVLPTLGALGVSTIWIRPVNGGYNPDDYYRLDDEVGTSEDFRDYTARAHALGLSVWHDAVPHGGSSKFKRFQEHPEWLAYTKAGKPAFTYWCSDFNWPSWAEYMGRYCEDFTRDYALDGWRMDVPYGARSENWSRAIPYARASYAQLQGGLSQQRAIRAGARRANPDAVTLAESLWNVHGTTADAVYDIKLCHTILCSASLGDTADFVRQLRLFLHEQASMGFPGLVRMRYIESHDSLRALKLYGLKSKNLLFALTAFLEGFPMIYEEGEDGSFEAYRRALAYRAVNPALTYGKTVWLDKDVPDGVLAFRRELEEVCVTVALNFNATDRVFQDEVVPALDWRLFGAHEPAPRRPYVFHPANGALTIEKSVEEGRRVYRFRNGERWFARTAEGNFESPWIVRHPTFEKVDGFVYRTTIEGAVRFDSAANSLGFDPARNQVGAFSGDEAAYLTGFASGARVKVLDRVGDDHVLAVAVEGPTGERLETCATAAVDLRNVETGDGRVVCDFGGWRLTSGALSVRINRHGVLVGVWRNGRKVHGRIELMTDEGKSGWSQRIVRQGWDADTVSTLKRETDGTLVMRFEGATRSSSRQYEARNSAPIAYDTVCKLSPDGSFSYVTGYDPDKKLVVDRGTRFYFEIEDADGKVTRDYRTGSGRFSRAW